MTNQRILSKLFPSIVLTAIAACISASAMAGQPATAPVAGFARSFLVSMPLPGATITVLETGERFKTDKTGHFGPFEYEVGKPITLQFDKWGYKTTQSGTVIVPKEGLAGPFDNITFQIPSIETYYLLASIIGATIDDNSCHLTTTITKFHKTMDDLPQGEEGAVIKVSPAVSDVPFYFGIYESGPLKGKTNPFIKGLVSTSDDGGVAITNLPPRDEPYVISATKDGKVFSEASFLCTAGAFINVSPPRGPMVMNNTSVPHRTLR